jgi:glucokinase
VSHHLFLGIEIGGTKLQLGLGAADGRLLALERLAVRNPAGGGTSADDIRSQIAGAIDPLLGRLQASRRDVKAVGIGFGGPVDSDRGVVVKSFQVPGWEGFPLADWVRDELGVSTVSLHNDADTAGLGEARFGAGVGLSPIVYVTVGSGIGGGLIIDGRIYRGAGAGAMEIGHLLTDMASSTACAADREISGGAGENDTRASLEEIASGWSIAARASSKLRQKIKADPGYRSPLASMLGPEGGPQRISAQMVAQAAALGDEVALQVLDDATTHLGRAFANMVTLLAPGRIILGGGVSSIGEDLWFAPIRRELDRCVFPLFRGTFDLVAAALGEEVVVHGALALARDAYSATHP